MHTETDFWSTRKAPRVMAGQSVGHVTQWKTIGKIYYTVSKILSTTVHLNPECSFKNLLITKE